MTARVARSPRRPTALGLLLLTLVGAACGCARHQPNAVATFLHDAERQAETPAHRLEIRHALSDMLQMTPQQLAQQRYRDYDGMPGAWSAPELLQRYFVPAQDVALDSTAFYRDVSAPAAHKAIQAQLKSVEQAIADDQAVTPPNAAPGGAQEP